MVKARGGEKGREMRGCKMTAGGMAGSGTTEGKTGRGKVAGVATAGGTTAGGTTGSGRDAFPENLPGALENDQTAERLRPDEEKRLRRLGEREAALRLAGFRAIAGLDEAGRGPLAGPVVAAAVILPAGLLLKGLNDSKKVSPSNRLRLEAEIKEKAVAWGIGEASYEEIDEYNILEATRLAMARAVEKLTVPPDYLLLDAIKLSLPLPQESIIRGDAEAACISAASILAKTHRDRLMEEWDRRYPGYGFCRNKGYPTAEHRRAVIEKGACPIHRQSFLGFAEKEREKQLRLFP